MPVGQSFIPGLAFSYFLPSGHTTDSFLSLVTCKLLAKQTEGFSYPTINSSAPDRNAGCSEQHSTAAASQTSPASG